jgi:hypothetical protein
MHKYASAVAIIMIGCGLPHDCISAPAEPAAAMTFTGECIKFDGSDENHNYCENTVSDLRFADGYDSLQFKTLPKNNNDLDRDVTSFVGIHWLHTDKLGSGLIAQSQKATAAAMQIAEK